MTTRFMPDTWRDALLRPVAMASPDGGVYVEFLAPDFRFVFILVLLLGWAAARGWRRPGFSAVLLLLAFTAAAFVPWLATTGNGRYFLPFLLITGPLCIGLLHLLPVTRGMRLLAAAGMVAWQAFLCYEISPWRSWTFVHWGEGPAFEVEIPPDLRAEPATYVGLSSISYSIIAPQFHPGSRWINVSSQRGLGDRSRNGLWTQAFLRDSAQPLRLIFPSLPQEAGPPAVEAPLQTALDDLLAPHGLAIAAVAQCRYLPSASLSRVVKPKPGAPQASSGFWVCPLHRGVQRRQGGGDPVDPRAEAVFDKMERACPRLFPRGDTSTLRIPAGALRGYPSSDFKLYVLSEGAGTVMYKYYRALNPVQVGTIPSVLAPNFKIDCTQVQGRTGLPWERGI